MTSISNSTATAEIVDMMSLLDSTYRKRSNNASTISETATLLSIRQNLTYQGAIGVDQMAAIRNNYSHAVADEVLASLRELLNVEFGHLRVFRHKQVFVVSHHCLETLIAGLLRVQFHGKQLKFPADNALDELADKASIAFTWGAGMSAAEAEIERQQRYKLK